MFIFYYKAAIKQVGAIFSGLFRSRFQKCILIKVNVINISNVSQFVHILIPLQRYLMLPYKVTENKCRVRVLGKVVEAFSAAIPEHTTTMQHCR